MATQAESPATDAARPAQETIEQKLVDESKKAGVPAFQFDPDASPEKKAEQAKMAIPAGFQKNGTNGTNGTQAVNGKKADAVALATDMGATNGTKKPAEMEKADEAEKPKMEVKELTEEEKFAPGRTGWAPRFSAPAAEEGAGEEPGLPPTLLEGKLEDKFFGDWYHNTAVIIFACLASWIIALFGGGLGWVFLIMAACGTYYRTSVRRVRRNFRDDITRELAKNKLETDTETLEWINSFLAKFWPIYAPNLAHSIICSVDQVLSTSTPAFLDSLRLKTFTLGSKPPRLEHVKTYPKTEPDIVLMDWKFSFTPADKMDLTARQIKDKINPKVVLEVRVGKGIVSKGLDVIVEDFAFSGLMRVKVKLQIQFPHVERIDISFLGKPEIDYVCKPIGGETLGFDINFIPGLETFITEQIHGNLAPMMYDPNVFPVEIAKMLAGNPVDQAIGVLAVTIHGANGLKKADQFSGTPDPYTLVSINSRTELGRTKTVSDTANPKWNETLYVIITSFTDALTLQVFDWNEFRKDVELGTATFSLESLETEEVHENLNLDIMQNGRHRGVMQADVRFFPVLTSKKTDGGAIEPPPELNTGIAKFTVEQAKDLDGSKSFIGQLNPYAVLLLNGKEVHITKKLKRTNNPIFPDPSKEILITDRKTARLGMMIKDDRDLATDPILGKQQMKLNDMLNMMDKGKEWFELAGAKTGRVKMRLEWKPVALKGVVGSGGYINPIGVMRLHIKNAKDLRNVETMGKSDPYLRVMKSGMEVRRTVTWLNNLNPEWDEVLYIPVNSAREKLVLEVMDDESIGKDRPLGLVELNVGEYIKEGEDGEYEVHDEKRDLSTPLKLDGRSSQKGVLNYTAAFYPTFNVVDPDEEADELEAQKELAAAAAEEEGKPTDADTAANAEATTNGDARPSTDGLVNGEKAEKEVPKIRLTPQDVHKYVESGLIVFKLEEGDFSSTGTQLEVLMDDNLYPSYTSPKIQSKHMVFGDVGDAFVPEMEFSKITLRLVDKSDRHSDDSEDNSIAKLSGPTLATLQQCLYKPTELILRGSDGINSKVTVSLKYLPVKMKLDPSESINNMGNLRVDVLDAADLPSADRNGYSDPYCKFKLGDKEVFKTKVQKKTLHPAWNEFFETPIKSRIAANLRADVYDWDFGDKADYLGGTIIDLTNLDPFQAQEISLPLDGKSGAIRLKLLFKPAYVTRSRQGSSTFSGTFAAPGKIVGAPVKGVTMLGGGVVKGASFLKHGFKRSSRAQADIDAEPEAAAATATNGTHGHTPSVEVSAPGTPQHAGALADSPSGSPVMSHSRSRSSASQAGLGVSSIKGETGAANITIVSATGYPRSTNVRVVVKQQTSKGMKEIHKSKAHKAHGSSETESVVQFDPGHETIKINSVTADAQFQLQVKDHAVFGSDDILGEALFFLDDQGSNAGKERNVKVGNGFVTIKTVFTSSESSSLRPGTSHSNTGPEESTADSPKPRRSFLSKRSVSGVGAS
ncbi:Tricalbin [Trichophyton interdigitale]|uniref:Tricalbin n=1 Tax=Trichophyton interdigitale TaxID=101480 RepID=A0A9P4YEZ1_9EURO|nr:Tricalbin [Trichophyton interdigitale]KAF3892334.1 Tricalbin [Trichophyton interdigitale]KAG8207618.1 Tricalbin [Trichophyton interdigitale]